MYRVVYRKENIICIFTGRLKLILLNYKMFAAELNKLHNSKIRRSTTKTWAFF